MDIFTLPAIKYPWYDRSPSKTIYDEQATSGGENFAAIFSHTVSSNKLAFVGPTFVEFVTNGSLSDVILEVRIGTVVGNLFTDKEYGEIWRGDLSSVRKYWPLPAIVNPYEYGDTIYFMARTQVPTTTTVNWRGTVIEFNA